MAAELAAFAPPPSASPNPSPDAPLADPDSAGQPWAVGANTSGGLLDDAATPGALASPGPLRDLIGKVTGSRRNLAIAAGGALLLGIVLVAALGGGSDDKPTTVASSSTTPPPETPPTPPPEPEKPTTDEAQPAEPVAEPAAEPAEAPPEEPPPAEVTTPAPTPPTPAKPVAKPKTLGGKRLVLEYDAQATKATKPVVAARTDQAAIAKARASYAAGNQRLLAGDWNGAVLKYRQSLANYPGYVAGYRGLGLAFMQMGDTPKALQALRLYVNSVPNAKDAPLIRKRIETLRSRAK